MLLLGHVGITLGAAAVLAAVAGKRHRPGRKESAASPGDSWFVSLRSRVDIRLVLIGSLLPDIIDKPVGQVFFRETFNNGRIFSHTLLFLLALTLSGAYLYRRRRSSWLLALSFGTLVHLLSDRMWESPRTLLRPIYGLTFGRADLGDWLGGLLRDLVTRPAVYLPELLGVAVLAWFVVILARRGRLGTFLRNGRV